MNDDFFSLFVFNFFIYKKKEKPPNSEIKYLSIITAARFKVNEKITKKRITYRKNNFSLTKISIAKIKLLHAYLPFAAV